VKFLCDRCKTRYSIGDDRVRGKILKIRCKNCANVITVREGMTADPDASLTAPEYVARAKKATTMAPAANDERTEPARDRDAEAPTEPAGGARPASGATSPPATARALPGVAKPPLGTPRSSQGAATEPLGPSKKPGAARSPLGAAKPSQGAPTEPLGGPKPAARAAAADKAPGSAKPPGAAKDSAPRSGAAKRAPGDPARGQPGAAKRPAGQEFLRGEPVNALGAAFASAMARPPPALEEEWYVSIDGDQSGPFSLAEAQAWVAQKPFEAELHCWSEGFDDWLPVDKVSHFRGLRKRPVGPGAAAPPPVPRTAAPARGAASPPAHDEPRPLFAATMAALERGAPSAPGGDLELPTVPSPARAPAFGTAVPPRTNGAAAAPGGAPPPGAPVPRPAGSLGPVYGGMVDDPFGLNDLGELGDSATQIEQPPFADEPGAISAAAGPVVRPTPRPSSSDELTPPHEPASSTLHGTGANAAMTTAAVTAAADDMGFADDDEGGDLSIGEVSRVVNLADIARPPEHAAARRPGTNPVARTGQSPRLRSTGVNASMRMTGPSSRLRSTGAVPNLAGAALAGSAPAEGDPGVSLAPVAKSHRRGLIALLGVAIVVVLVVGGAVFVFVTNEDGPTGGSLGPVHDIDTSRPDEPTAHRATNPGGSNGPAIPTPPPEPLVPRPPRVRPTPAGGNHEAEAPGPGVESLRGEEIEDVARRNQDMTQRCYLRSQRGVDSILVGDVKKIAVTLTIDKDGRVSDVQLSDHGGDALGKCLSGSIRGWKFRPSSGGTFKFSLNFVSG
jgi:predicted Zn finger-like uncharacterized protein